MEKPIKIDDLGGFPLIFGLTPRPVSILEITGGIDLNNIGIPKSS